MRATLASGGAQASGNRRLRQAFCGPMSIGCDLARAPWKVPSGRCTPHCSFSDCP